MASKRSQAVNDSPDRSDSPGTDVSEVDDVATETPSESEEEFSSTSKPGHVSVRRRSARQAERTVRQRAPKSRSHASESTKTHTRSLRSNKRQTLESESLPESIANDAWDMFKTILRLVSTSYPIWKWVLLAYIAWLAVSYPVIALYGSVTGHLQSICALPIIGSRLEICKLYNIPNEKPFDVSKVTNSQNELTLVGGQVGQSYEIARGMVGHEFAIRDLKIRVAGSALPRAPELVKELEALSRYTKQTAK
jgi:hypothetical protein